MGNVRDYIGNVTHASRSLFRFISALPLAASHTPRAAKSKELLALGAFPSPEEADRLRSAEAAAAREEELLSGDAEMLRSWASTLTVRVNGREHKHT